MSLSARRAWIEKYAAVAAKPHRAAVALRKESVDRKIHPVAVQAGAVASLSARRAWIEKYQWP